MRGVDHPRSATNITDIDPSITFIRASSRPHLAATKPGRVAGCRRLDRGHFSFKPRTSAGGGHPGRGAALTVAPRRASPYPRVRIGCLGSGSEKLRVALGESDSGLPRLLESGRRVGGQQSRLKTSSMVEVSVHLDLDWDTLPDDYVLFAIDAETIPRASRRPARDRRRMRLSRSGVVTLR